MLASQGKRRFDVIDVSPDFSSQSETNKFAFTAEAVRGYLGILRDRGVVSIPMSIREFTVYALKLLETVREGLRIAGVEAPEKHIMLYRSGWSARILVSPAPFTEQGFRAFNEIYVVTLQKWGIYDGKTNPVARSNVCPEIDPPAEPSFYAFSFVRPSTNATPAAPVRG